MQRKYAIRISILLGIGLIFILIIGLWAYPIFIAANTTPSEQPQVLYIHTESTLDDVVYQLKNSNIIKNEGTFRQCARWLNYKSSVKPGRYRIPSGISNLYLVRQLRSGNQSPVRLTINNVRTIEELSGKIAEVIEPDSLALLDAFSRIPEYAPDIPLGADSALCLFIPNTYEVWWNTSPLALLERMWKEYQQFWNEERLNKSGIIGMTPNEVYILASIVEKETRVASEKATIAGVYLNRLRMGMPLQADPTVVFALKAFDKERILYEDLTYESPYNTYLHTGLPPGPICMPEISSIDAVLKAEQHEYVYFCAKPDNSGGHAFAKTLAAHGQNARRFRRWLDTRGIR